MRFILTLCVLIASPLLGAEPTAKPAAKPKISFPKLKVPAVAPADTATVSLLDDVWMVVESDVDLEVIVFPPKSLKLLKAKGPATLGGTFVDSDGTDEVRVFQGPFVTMIRKAKDASGEVNAAFVPYGFTDASSIAYKRILLGKAPQPPPVVVDPPVIVPPGPVVPTGFRVLLLHDSSKPMTQEQQHIFNSTQIIAYLNSHCVKDSRGLAEWRNWDVKTLKIGPTESPTITALYNSTKSLLPKYPQLVVAVNGDAKVYDLDKYTEASTLEFLKTQGGM